MNNKIIILFISCILFNDADAQPSAALTSPPSIDYFSTRTAQQEDNYHGTTVEDPFRWLEDDRSEETAGWVKKQNELTEKYLGNIRFRLKIKERLTSLWNYPRQGVPFKDGNYYFVYKNNGIQNQSVLYVQQNLKEVSKVFIDPNTLSDDGTVSLGFTRVSRDSRYFAYSLSKGGSDWNDVYIREISTEKNLNDTIRWVKFSGISWHQNGFYYSGYSKPAPGDELKKKNEYHKVFYHTVGTPQSSDKLIYEDKDKPLRNFGASVTEDEKFLVLVSSEGTSGNDLKVKNLMKKKSDFIPITSGYDNDYDFVDNENDWLFIQTNYKAPNGRVISVDANNPSKENWMDLIPEKEDAVLQGVTVAGDLLVARYMKNAVNYLEFFSRQGKSVRMFRPEIPATIESVSGDRKDSLLFFSITSFVYPSVVYKYNLITFLSEKIFTPDIRFDFDQYETKQEWYQSKDGTKIPIFLVHKKGIPMDGNNPVFLYGYGGFNISMNPNFAVWRLLFLEAGGIYASANIRGGGEFGETWHKAGTKLQKQNVFDDFIAAAEYLIDKKFTNPSRIAIHGRSNGGLLVGACMTQRPDLFKVALPGVGVMDMLRFHKFTIGWAWTSDYGSSDNPEEFKSLYAYSPLHNIREGVNYPATLVTTADHDDRVVPAHSFKFISELQRKKGPENPALIRIDVMAGHGAGKPISKQIDEWTDVLSFTLFNLNMKY